MLNSLLNSLAYNPPGKEEGYLFWGSWVNHAGASIFQTQDAHGPIRRGQVIASCNSIALLENVVATNPQLEVLYELLEAPASEQICPSPIGPGVPEPGTAPPPSKAEGLGVDPADGSRAQPQRQAADDGTGLARDRAGERP